MTKTKRIYAGRMEVEVNGTRMTFGPIYKDEDLAGLLRRARDMLDAYEAIPGNEGKCRVILVPS